MKRSSLSKRRSTLGLLIGLFVIIAGFLSSQVPPESAIVNQPTTPPSSSINLVPSSGQTLAAQALANLPIKGRAPKTGYQRSEFGNGWRSSQGCDMRNRILQRDLINIKLMDNSHCIVMSGTLVDPYTGSTIDFKRGNKTSGAVQIDHVVALSDAWQKGAQKLSAEERIELANDPLELLAVDGPINQQKGDGDAATWLPPNKPFRCQYVARQIAIKQKYNLWLTTAEHQAIQKILSNCPDQLLPSP